jgi:uncharacterized protein YecE (DUF72 family)
MPRCGFHRGADVARIDANAAASVVRGCAPQFFVGTASWTDPTLVKSGAFYPPDIKTAEDRLRFYAAHFNTVEVDSTYYTLINRRVAQLWAERTPPKFVFNVKAFGLLTQHPVETNRLPKALLAMLPTQDRARQRLTVVSTEVREQAFEMFRGALQPLALSGKLGVLLFQFPPYFTRRGANVDYLATLKTRLPDSDIAVEFRHPSWVVPDSSRAETMNFLSRHGLYYVSVDEPQSPSTVPSFLAVTGDCAYVRFHGRNRTNWFKRGLTTAERYMYLYSEAELQHWAAQLKRLSGVKRAFVIFNNCYQNFGVMNATTMAQILRD